MPITSMQMQIIAKMLENSTANDPARPKVEPNKLLQVAPVRFVETNFRLQQVAVANLASRQSTVLDFLEPDASVSIPWWKLCLWLPQ